jgi:hypothetical protein
MTQDFLFSVDTAENTWKVLFSILELVAGPEVLIARFVLWEKFSI